MLSTMNRDCIMYLDSVCNTTVLLSSLDDLREVMFSNSFASVFACKIGSRLYPSSETHRRVRWSSDTSLIFAQWCDLNSSDNSQALATCHDIFKGRHGIPLDLPQLTR